MKRCLFFNKNYFHYNLFWFVFLFLFVSCSEPTPHNILSKYLEARYIRIDYKKAMNYVSTKDKPFFKKYLTLLPQKTDPLVRYTAVNTSYTIGNFDILGDQATAEVVLKWRGPIKSGPGLTMANSLYVSLKPEEFFKEMEKLKVYSETHSGEDEPLFSYHEIYSMIKEKDGWKVSLDLESKKSIKIGEQEFPPI